MWIPASAMGEAADRLRPSLKGPGKVNGAPGGAPFKARVLLVAR